MVQGNNMASLCWRLCLKQQHQDHLLMSYADHSTCCVLSQCTCCHLHALLYLQVQMLQWLSVPVPNMLHTVQTDVQRLAEICTSSRMGRNACPVSIDTAVAVVCAAAFVTRANTLATLGDSPARSCTETGLSGMLMRHHDETSCQQLGLIRCIESSGSAPRQSCELPMVGQSLTIF